MMRLVPKHIRSFGRVATQRLPRRRQGDSAFRSRGVDMTSARLALVLFPVLVLFTTVTSSLAAASFQTAFLPIITDLATEIDAGDAIASDDLNADGTIVLVTVGRPPCETGPPS